METATAGRPPAVAGIFETSLYVADLARPYAFYRDLFGFELIGTQVTPDDRLAALRVGDRQVLLLFRYGAPRTPAPADGRSSLPHDAQGQIHVAFAVAAADIDDWGRLVLDARLAIERTIDWRPGARSHCLRDPDGHLVELATPGVWGNW